MMTYFFVLIVLLAPSIFCEKPISRAPYQPSGWKPEGNAFELPTKSPRPSSQYLPSKQDIDRPTNSYGAPNFNLPIIDSSYAQYLPPPSIQDVQNFYSAPQQAYGTPDQKYGAPALKSEYGAPQNADESEDVDNDAADYSDENDSVSMVAAQNGFQRLNKQKFMYQGSLTRDSNRRY